MNQLPLPEHTAQSQAPIAVTIEDLIRLQYQAKAINLAQYKNLFTANTGNRVSRIHGRGIEFEEVREYQPGDDIATIDWRVTARTGRPHTKVFRQERDWPLYLIVDMRAPMYFGTRVTFKSVLAAKLAAMFAWAANNNSDRVGGMVISDEKTLYMPAKAGSHGVLRLLHAIANQSQQMPKQYNDTQSLTAALWQLRPKLRPGALVVVLSDFHDINMVQDKQNNNSPDKNNDTQNTANKQQDLATLLPLLALRQQMICTMISDPIEHTAPPPNRYACTDGNERIVMDTRSYEFRHAFNENFQTRWQSLSSICQSSNISLLQFDTNQVITPRTILKNNSLKQNKAGAVR